MAAASPASAETIFAAIQKLPAVQIQALLFAACQNHTDVAMRVLEAVEENEHDEDVAIGSDDEDDEDGVRAKPPAGAGKSKTAGRGGARRKGGK